MPPPKISSVLVSPFSRGIKITTNFLVFMPLPMAWFLRKHSGLLGPVNYEIKLYILSARNTQGPWGDWVEEGLWLNKCTLGWGPTTNGSNSLMGYCAIKKSLWWAAAAVKSLQSCPTLCDLMDCSPPDSSVCGILQAKTLQWVAMPSSRGSSRLRDQTYISYIFCIDRWVLYH